MGISNPFESPSLILLGVLSTQHKFSGHYHFVITHFRTPEISYPLLICQRCLAELPLWQTQLCAYQSSWICLRKDSPVLTGLILSLIVNPLSGTSVLPGIHNMFPQSIHSLFSWRISSYFPLSPLSQLMTLLPSSPRCLRESEKNLHRFPHLPTYCTQVLCLLPCASTEMQLLLLLQVTLSSSFFALKHAWHTPALWTLCWRPGA